MIDGILFTEGAIWSASQARYVARDTFRLRAQNIMLNSSCFRRVSRCIPSGTGKFEIRQSLLSQGFNRICRRQVWHFSNAGMPMRILWLITRMQMLADADP